MQRENAKQYKILRAFYLPQVQIFAAQNRVSSALFGYNRGKDMLAPYGHKLCHTHFNDNVGVTGKDIFWTDDLHLLMGDGIADWQDIMRRIRACDYRGVLTCELTLANKPGKNTHDSYAAMPIKDFYTLALSRMQAIGGMGR